MSERDKLEQIGQEYLSIGEEAIRGGHSFDASITTGAALLSIAVSMKRIADEVCGVPYDHTPGADNSRHRMGITDGVMHAIEQGILAASQRG